MTFAIRRSARQPTGRYEFSTISLNPNKPITLIVRVANATNGPYWSEVLKDANVGRTGGNVQLDETVRQAAREDYADRFAKHVVVGWENVVDSAGAPVPCTPAAVREFLGMLITVTPLANGGDESYRDVFDMFRAWCQNEDNFRSPIADPVELGKK